jgi:hypothetical protein
MNLSQFDGPLAEWLGWALIHFLWQGTLLAAVLASTLNAMRRRSAQARYLVACGCMALMASRSNVSVANDSMKCNKKSWSKRLRARPLMNADFR